VLTEARIQKKLAVSTAGMTDAPKRLAQRLVQEAMAIVREEGPDSLSVREVRVVTRTVTSACVSIAYIDYDAGEVSSVNTSRAHRP
jgi:hypothetical protein